MNNNIDGKLLWSHLKDLYKINRPDAGLALSPRLEYGHIDLTSYSKMRVCSYFFNSNSVVKAL